MYSYLVFVQTILFYSIVVSLVTTGCLYYVITAIPFTEGQRLIAFLEVTQQANVRVKNKNQTALFQDII